MPQRGPDFGWLAEYWSDSEARRVQVVAASVSEHQGHDRNVPEDDSPEPGNRPKSGVRPPTTRTHNSLILLVVRADQGFLLGRKTPRKTLYRWEGRLTEAKVESHWVKDNRL